jgi:hypothetical protein
MVLSSSLVALAVALLASSASAQDSSFERRASCSCGYRLSQYSNSYFRNLINADFTTTSLSGTATSSSWLSSYGFWIADGYQVGAVSTRSDATSPVGSYKNVRINNHLLELVVPGGQKITNGGKTTNAQLEGPSGIINGVFTMRAKIDDEKGTCQSIVRDYPTSILIREADLWSLLVYLPWTGHWNSR